MVRLNQTLPRNNTLELTSGTIKVPVVKVSFDPKVNCVLNGIDITVNNHEGVMNSEMLALYTAHPHILKLCLLAKKWAVSNHLVAKEPPFDKLSTYGVVLMAIFYLIKSEQAPPVYRTAEGKFILLGQIQ